jgi:type II secretory pathway pseudopilin PulG
MFFSLRKLYITLVELLLVIIILVMMTGIIGINIRKLVREQKFNSEVGLVVDELRFAQNLMMIVGYDIHVKFEHSKDGKGIQMILLLDKLLNKNWNREIERKRPKLIAIKKIDFLGDEKSSSISPENQNPMLSFYSKGSNMSRGILKISSSDSERDTNALVRYICLPGFPSPIISTSNLEEDPQCHLKNDKEYEDKLTTAIQREIAQRNLTPAQAHGTIQKP